MKTYNVFIPAFAGASYEVEAKSKEDAIEQAMELANLSDCTASDWDFETDPDVEEIEED